MGVSFKLAYQNIFKDEKWKFKIFIITVLNTVVVFSGTSFDKKSDVNPLFGLLGFLISLIIIGYSFKYTSIAIEDKNSKLPELDDFLTLFCIGLKGLIGGFIQNVIFDIFASIIAITLMIISQPLGIMIGVIILLYFYSLIPAFSINYAEEFYISMFWNFKKAKELAKFEYYKTLLLMVIMYTIPAATIILLLLTGCLNLICINIISSIFLTFSMLIYSHLLAQIYHNEHGERVNYGF